MTLTVRELAITALTDALEAITLGAPSGDPYTIQFDLVQRNPLIEEAWKKRLSIGVHDTAEDVKDGQNLRDCLLNVVLEFRRVLDTSEVGSTAGNEILGAIERKIGEDRTLGGHVIDCIESRNEVYVEDFNKRQLSGAVWLALHYRTAALDPRVKRF
jgi:hypothetical protein